MNMTRKNQKRQAGSLKLWKNDKNDTYWASVNVHRGRVTTRVRGQETFQIEDAQELLEEELN